MWSRYVGVRVVCWFTSLCFGACQTSRYRSHIEGPNVAKRKAPPTTLNWSMEIPQTTHAFVIASPLELGIATYTLTIRRVSRLDFPSLGVDCNHSPGRDVQPNSAHRWLTKHIVAWCVLCFGRVNDLFPRYYIKVRYGKGVERLLPRPFWFVKKVGLPTVVGRIPLMLGHNQFL